MIAALLIFFGGVLIAALVLVITARYGRRRDPVEVEQRQRFAKAIERGLTRSEVKW